MSTSDWPIKLNILPLPATPSPPLHYLWSTFSHLHSSITWGLPCVPWAHLIIPTRFWNAIAWEALLNAHPEKALYKCLVTMHYIKSTTASTRHGIGISSLCSIYLLPLPRPLSSERAVILVAYSRQLNKREHQKMHTKARLPSDTTDSRLGL